MSKQWRDPKAKNTVLGKGSARGQKHLGEKLAITNKNRAFVFGSCHLALAGCTKDGMQAKLPSPIFDTGVAVSKNQTNVNIGHTSVDMATDFQNQPDQWCQAFTFAHSHLLHTRQHPTPLEFVEVLLFISTDRARDTLRRACVHAIKCLEEKELRHFNDQLPIWDDKDVMDYVNDPQKYKSDLDNGNIDDAVHEKVKWINHLYWNSCNHRSYFQHHSVPAKTKKPSMFKPFNPRRPTGNHLFEVDAGVIQGSNPIAHLRKHQYGFLYYKQFFDHVIKYMQNLVFRDYGGYKEAAETQLSYLENDLDISGSNIHADKFFQLLGSMETLFQGFPMETCTRLGQGNSIPDASKKKIAYNAMAKKYDKQLQARSRLSESSFAGWYEVEKVFIECQRAYVEEEKSQKASQKEQEGNKSKTDEPATKKRKPETEECSYCKDVLGKFGNQVNHSIKQCRLLKAKQNNNNNSGGGTKSKKYKQSQINALLKDTKMSKKELIAALSEEKNNDE